MCRLTWVVSPATGFDLQPQTRTRPTSTAYASLTPMSRVRCRCCWGATYCCRSGLGPGLPGPQVLLLCRGETVDVHTHRLELESCDLGVDGAGNVVDPSLQRGGIGHDPLRGQGLVGEAHVHDGGGMTFGRAQVDEATLGDDQDTLTPHQ